MVISNLICIQITSPGGTPIRGKNAGYRKCLLILLSSSLPPLLHVLPSPQYVPYPALYRLHHHILQKHVWSWKRWKQVFFSNKITDKVYPDNLPNDVPTYLLVPVGKQRISTMLTNTIYNQVWQSMYNIRSKSRPLENDFIRKPRSWIMSTTIYYSLCVHAFCKMFGAVSSVC